MDIIRTLIDSTPGVMKAWITFGKDYGIDPEVVAHAAHGRRLYDTLKVNPKQYGEYSQVRQKVHTPARYSRLMSFPAPLLHSRNLSRKSYPSYGSS